MASDRGPLPQHHHDDHVGRQQPAYGSVHLMGFTAGFGLVDLPVLSAFTLAADTVYSTTQPDELLLGVAKRGLTREIVGHVLQGVLGQWLVADIVVAERRVLDEVEHARHRQAITSGRAV